MKGLLFLLPALIFLFMTIAFPLFKVFQYSFQEFSFKSHNFKFVGLSQYKDVFSDKLFWISLKNTFIFAISSVIIHQLIAWPLALLLNTKWPNDKLRNIFSGITLTPYLFSFIATALLWSFLYRPLGNLHFIMQTLFGTTISFLGDSKWALFSIVLVNGWACSSIYMLFILGGLQSINKSLYEAAEVDGVNRLQSFLYITIPLMRTMIMTTVILDFATTFVHFDLVWMLTRGGPQTSTYLMSFLIYQKGIQEFNLGYGSAVGVIMVIIISLAVALYILFYPKESLSEG